MVNNTLADFSHSMYFAEITDVQKTALVYMLALAFLFLSSAVLYLSFAKSSARSYVAKILVLTGLLLAEVYVAHREYVAFKRGYNTQKRLFFSCMFDLGVIFVAVFNCCHGWPPQTYILFYASLYVAMKLIFYLGWPLPRSVPERALPS